MFSWAWRAAFRASVLESNAALEAELWRGALPLTVVQGLKPGARLPLPADCLGAVTLRPRGRPPVATGRLGQLRGQRALKLAGGEAGAPDTAPVLQETPLAVVGAPDDSGSDPAPIPASTALPQAGSGAG